MICLGLDLGQRRDHSALAIVERRVKVASRMDYAKWRQTEEVEAEPLVVRHLERMELGTQYFGVAQRVKEVVEWPGLAGRKILAVDATGVGMPVVEMLAEQRMGCELRPVVMTGGMGQSTDGVMWHVAKVDLMAGLREALERGELKFAGEVAEGERLVEEMMSVTVGIRQTGRERVGADGCGEHDDLVIAVALACWAARQGKPMEKPGNRLFW